MNATQRQRIIDAGTRDGCETCVLAPELTHSQLHQLGRELNAVGHAITDASPRWARRFVRRVTLR